MAISSPAMPLLLFLPTLLLPYSTLGASTKLFSEYIGAQFNGIKFTDVPINLDVQFHFILAFAIDYTSSTSGGSYHPTNGKFNVFWDSENLSASQVRSIKARHPNVKVALSLGGDSIGEHEQYVMFKATSVTSWVQNAVTSITQIIKDYDLDGIDIDYEHFASTTSVFTECIGQLITTLKKRKVISFASIAPFEEVQGQYMALWAKYKNVIDYVNFQFYAYDEGTTVAQFIKYFNEQTSNYEGGKVLASFTTEGKGGLLPENGFFTASNRLKSQGKLHGIFIWSADNSKDKGNGFQYERRSQSLLASTSN